MEKITRGIVALVILLAGVALIPFVSLPTEAISWQQYAGVYDAFLAVNYTEGQPGSFFTFSGSNYPPNSIADVTLNSQQIGSVASDSGGNFTFILNTYGLDPGLYTVTAAVNANASASVTIELIAGGQYHSSEGSGPVISALPLAYLPVIKLSTQ